MCIVEVQFNLRPDTDAGEMARLFDELAVPIYRKIPGCISANVYKYEAIGDNRSPEYDYAFIEVWESKEANMKALSDKYIGFDGSQLQNTGFYNKLGALVTGIEIAARALPLGSGK